MFSHFDIKNSEKAALTGIQILYYRINGILDCLIEILIIFFGDLVDNLDLVEHYFWSVTNLEMLQSPYDVHKRDLMIIVPMRL